MLVTAEEVSGADIAGPVVVLLLLTGAVIFRTGYRLAVMHRANSDYKKTKSALPLLRKDFWRTWWAMIKVAFVVGLIAFALIAWWLRDAGRSADTTTVDPTPTPSATRQQR